MMINAAQVVTAVAGGSLLTLAAVPAARRLSQPRLEEAPQRSSREEDDERERRIEVATQMAVNAFDLIAEQADAKDPPLPHAGGSSSFAVPPISEAAETFPRPSGRTPQRKPSDNVAVTHGAVAVRSKRHLRMLVFGWAAPVGALLLEVWRAHRSQVVSVAVGATAAASTVTAVTVMPYLLDDVGVPAPPAAVTSSPWTSPPQGDRTLSEATSSALPSSSPSPTASSATPSPSTSLTPSVPPETSAVSVAPTVADDDLVASERAPASPSPTGESRRRRGGGSGRPAHGGSERPNPPSETVGTPGAPDTPGTSGTWPGNVADDRSAADLEDHSLTDS
ncbi:hypothetical protein ACWEQ7_02985 [Streptomyces sp. NPDC004069]